MTDLTEKTLASERKYTGKIISVDLLDIELPDGRKAKREVIRHNNAVAILARRPDGKFVFVKQYRKAAEEACPASAPRSAPRRNCSTRSDERSGTSLKIWYNNSRPQIKKETN